VPLVLDVLRHAEAGPAGPSGDAERALTPAGRRAIAALATRLASEGWRPGRIFTSPLLRARQTAEIARAASPHAPAIEPLEELRAEREPADVLAALAAAGAGDGHVLLVTHQPLAGRLAALLTGSEAPFKPGTLARFECPAGPRPGGGRLVMSVPPAAG
jgi:phosphohistidine phosphatase